jgi:arabinose-5-phosphate isomerase
VLKELFTQKKLYIDYFFDKLNIEKAEELLKILHGCQGTIVFTGVGKSGLIAKKIAMTMTSTGTRAFYLSPTNALHGDLGILTDKDVFIMLSKSGETDELLHLIPYLRNKHVKIVGVVCNGNSRLAKACDFSITLPMEKELCPYDLAPTTSTVIQMIFGDVMTIALMQMHNFSLDQYALNHPAGRIGKRITVKVEDLMLKEKSVPICRPEDKLVESLVELSNKKCGCLLVVNKEMVLEGIFTDGDLRRALQKHGATVLDQPISKLMSLSPRFINPGKLAWEAMQLMEHDQKNAITCMPVIDATRKVLGLIRLHDIVQSGL